MSDGAAARARHVPWLLTAALVAGALVAIVIVAAVRASTVAAAPPTLQCDAELTFGESVSCSVSGPAAAVIDWADGSTEVLGEAGDAGAVREHQIDAVGALTVSLVDGADVVATAPVTVVPDVRMDCGEAGEREVFELMYADELDYWGQVFINKETGARVEPGDADYPTVVVPSNWDPVVLDRVNETTTCRAESAALDAFDGRVEWLFESPYHYDRPISVRAIYPSPAQSFQGVQPVNAILTVIVNDQSASERRGVYFAACA